MLPLLDPFYGENPDVHLELHEDSGTQLLPMLTAGGLDAVFCRAPEHLPEGYVFEPLLKDDVVVIASVKHDLANGKKVPLQALANMCWVLPATNIHLHGIFETLVLSAFPDTQWFPVTTRSLHVLEGLLRQPKAVALLPRSLVAALEMRGQVCCLNVDIQAQIGSLGVAYHHEQMSPLLDELLAPARKMASSQL